MVDKAKAAEAKAKGNAAFTAKDYPEAIKHFTEAIGHDPTDHVFFSNRSACYASLNEYDKAFEDGSKCVELKPDWAKGYTRKGLAEFFLRKYDDAETTYKKGLELAPEDASLKEGMKKVQDAKSAPQGSGGSGSGFAAQMMMSLMMNKNPKVQEKMKDPQIMQKLQMLMKAPEEMQQQLMMQLIQQDPALLELFMAAQGVDVDDMQKAQAEAGGMGGGGPSSGPPPKKEEPKKEEPPPDMRTDSQKAADVWKDKGNAHYKTKEFEPAIEMYDKAIEAEPNDMTYYNNKAAVLVEMKEYDKCLKICQDLIDKRYEMNTALSGGASFEKVAKVFCRMAACYEKQNMFDEALAMYSKATTEDNSRQTRNAIRECERKREKWEKDRFLDPELAEKHNEAAKEFFKNNDWAKAKAEYDEAIKRNPADAKLFSNRAASLTKLMAYPDALRDLEECIKLDPKFVKAYSRKGAAHFFMKEYGKAMDAYAKGLQVDPGNEECEKGRAQVIAKIQETQSSKTVDEEQIRHAMADPEIQNILKDPQINLFLKSMQENPASAQDAMMKDPKIANAVTKLMAAGILRTG